MCNNNGACRKLSGGAMCPSYRATRNERDLTRGRANTLRLALTGQLGENALASDAMAETMSLCVSCKACQRECPMSVDMAKMKIEAQAARAALHGHSLRDRMIGHLPRYAPFLSKMPWLSNARNTVPGLARLLERPTGFSKDRKLPRWHRPARNEQIANADILLFADTFNRYFEPRNILAARQVLRALGLTVGEVASDDPRPLCCGRTYLSAGMVENARTEMTRSIAAFRKAIDAGIPVVGLEPSCVLTFRDEAPRLIDGWTEEMGRMILTFEEYIDAHAPDMPLRPIAAKRALLHGHCHQKAADIMGPVQRVLARIPELETELIDSSCCGMAGAFGYQSETRDVSVAMAELSLAPAIRAADPDTIIIASGTSCRHQISDITTRKARHVAEILAEALPEGA
jgi:Fe-S oxidoreductase